MTLSCLIVEAGIYSQVNATMPTSASPKAIDIFFFYTIVRLFLLCLHHTLNFRYVTYLVNKSKSGTKIENISKKIFAPSDAVMYPPELKNDSKNNTVENKGENSLPESINRKVLIYNVINFTILSVIDVLFFGIFVYEILRTRNDIYTNFESYSPSK